MSLSTHFPMELQSWFCVSSGLLRCCTPNRHAVSSELPFALFLMWVLLLWGVFCVFLLVLVLCVWFFGPAVISSLLTFLLLSFERKPSGGSAHPD